MKKFFNFWPNPASDFFFDKILLQQQQQQQQETRFIHLSYYPYPNNCLTTQHRNADSWATRLNLEEVRLKILPCRGLLAVKDLLEAARTTNCRRCRAIEQATSTSRINETLESPQTTVTSTGTLHMEKLSRVVVRSSSIVHPFLRKRGKVQ